MLWWQILLIIIGAVLTGALAGILVSYAIRLLRRKFLFQKGKEAKEPAPSLSGNESRPETAEAAARTGQAAGLPAEFLNELNRNFRIATAPPMEKMEPFETKIWDANLDGLQTLPSGIREDLTQAYVDMRLANSIVWLSTDLGRRSSDLDESYKKLCQNISARLARATSQLD